MTWDYNKQLDTWLYGTEENGIGLFLEDNEWHFNITTHYHVEHYGPFPKDFGLEGMKAVAEKEFEEVMKL